LIPSIRRSTRCREHWRYGEMPHDLLHNVETVEGCGKVDRRGIFRE
jgi:hypothetical protein